MKKLILRSFQSPGDILMLTAAVRDLHAAHPKQFQTDIRTSADALWLNNPFVTQLKEGDAGVSTVEMHYPLIHQSNQRPYHFLHGYAQYLEQQLDVRVPLTKFQGDVHLSPDEKNAPCPGVEFGVPDRFWIIVAGGKNDFTAKWWNPTQYQKVVDHFQGKIRFVQCGEQGHWHPRLSGVVNLVGKTTLRDFVRLMYHADGVLCPVTFAMHLAAAVDTKPGKPRRRPCVVVAGGREPPHWEAYPHHQFLATVGALSCCTEGGCWKSRCQLVGDGDEKDRRNVCENPVQISPELRIPKCMDMISAEDVIRRIDLYFQGGALNGIPEHEKPTLSPAAKPNGIVHAPRPATVPKKISVSFAHGLGDCAHFAHLIPLYVKRGYSIEVACTPDKKILFEAAGATTTRSGGASHPWGYPPGSTHAGHGQFWKGSKIGHNISERPLPNIGSKAELWDEYCQTTINVLPHLPTQAVETAERWLAKLPRPVVLLHTKGNTGQDRKSLPDAIAVEFYKALLDRFDGTIVLLDWDNRVPRLPSFRVRHLSDLGPCSLPALLALMSKSDLLVGVDSGPLHAARLTNIPCVGVWMPGHYPTTYSIPRRRQLNIVLADHTQPWNRFKRIPWRMVEHPGKVYDPHFLAEYCLRMLKPPRYLSQEEIASDVQMQQLVGSWCRGATGSDFCPFTDRHRSFDHLLREMRQRFSCPTVVETGTMRTEEDWSGAGFFTYWMGAVLNRLNGKLFSVDVDAKHCAFARIWTELFGDTVSVKTEDSVAYLTEFQEKIDVLYLDSLDTTEPGHAEHALREIETALPKTAENSLVLIDDTPWKNGAWIGKGAKAVPWLIERGWRVLYGGYQVLLSR